jgi:hypothetical protein
MSRRHLGSRRGDGDGDGDGEETRNVGHRAIDGDAELRVPEIGPARIEDGEGDIPVEAELVDCGGDGALPLDQADEGNDDAPVRRVESDWRLDGRQVVVEAARADGKELGKESESIASEDLKGRWEKGSRETDRGRELK